MKFKQALQEADYDKRDPTNDTIGYMQSKQNPFWFGIERDNYWKSTRKPKGTSGSKTIRRKKKEKSKKEKKKDDIL